MFFKKNGQKTDDSLFDIIRFLFVKYHFRVNIYIYTGLMWEICSGFLNTGTTVKPVYKDRSREKAKMVIIDRWYL